MFFIAKAISDDLLEEILVIAKGTVAEKRDEEYANSKDVSVYEFVKGMEKGKEYVIKDLTNWFRLFIGDEEKDGLFIEEHSYSSVKNASISSSDD
jgi:hypothetical protein